MKKFLCVICLFAFTSYSIADDETDMQVRLAIAAAKAKADREKKGKDTADVQNAIDNAHKKVKQKSTITEENTYKYKSDNVTVTESTSKARMETCYSDVNAARKIAKEKGKTLVKWTGITCDSHEAVRDALSDCVHCHVDADKWGKGLRIEIGNDTQYVIPDSSIDTVYSAKYLKDLAASVQKTKQVNACNCPDGVCEINGCADCGNCNCAPVNKTKATYSYPVRQYYYPQQSYYVPQQSYYVPQFSFPSLGGGCAGGSCGSGR